MDDPSPLDGRQRRLAEGYTAPPPIPSPRIQNKRRRCNDSGHFKDAFRQRIDPSHPEPSVKLGSHLET